ncbi:MAG: potassium channel family protein [Solirubrobacterales bacterium]
MGTGNHRTLGKTPGHDDPEQGGRARLRASKAESVPVVFPGSNVSQWQRLGLRLLLATGLILFVALVVFVFSDGYADTTNGDRPDLLDGIYYATVTATTTGYGDIIPVTTEARLASTFLVTPARVMFLILLVGTTLEILATGTKEAIKLSRWERKRRDHFIICGFGVKGAAAVDTLLGHGHEPDAIVVIDTVESSIERAQRANFVSIRGNAGSQEVLQRAGIDHAKGVIVAPNRDDTAVLITLTARELNPEVPIVTAVREEENVHLLRQSGASSVISSSGAAGRLLGQATYAAEVVDVLEELLTVGEGLDIVKVIVDEELAGKRTTDLPGRLVVQLIRGELTLNLDQVRGQELREGDELLCLTGEPKARNGSRPGHGAGKGTGTVVATGGATVQQD